MLFVTLVLKEATSGAVGGIAEGFASASPDNETTSQQDNEWGFARLRRQRTTDNGQQTTDNRTWASLDDYADL